jgi:hypothetical protein
MPVFYVPLISSFSYFFLSFDHPNNRFKNISILYLPLFKSVAQKKLLLNRKNIWGYIGGISPPLHPPSYAYAYKHISPLSLAEKQRPLIHALNSTQNCTVLTYHSSTIQIPTHSHIISRRIPSKSMKGSGVLILGRPSSESTVCSTPLEHMSLTTTNTPGWQNRRPNTESSVTIQQTEKKSWPEF